MLLNAGRDLLSHLVFVTKYAGTHPDGTGQVFGTAHPASGGNAKSAESLAHVVAALMEEDVATRARSLRFLADEIEKEQVGT